VFEHPHDKGEATVLPAEVQELCVEALSKGPDITAAEAWNEETRPFGLLITFTSGARLWVAITTSAATSGDSRTETATRPTAPPPLPALYEANQVITPARAELYLAALLSTGLAPQITSAYAYSDRDTPARHPGVGLRMANGARAYLPFVFNASANGRRAGARFHIHPQF
jgi:hypothetical protein